MYTKHVLDIFSIYNLPIVTELLVYHFNLLNLLKKLSTADPLHHLLRLCVSMLSPIMVKTVCVRQVGGSMR